LQGVADGGQGVAQLVGQHRQELVLPAVGFRRTPGRTCPALRRRACASLTRQPGRTRRARPRCAAEAPAPCLRSSWPEAGHSGSQVISSFFSCPSACLSSACPCPYSLPSSLPVVHPPSSLACRTRPPTTDRAGRHRPSCRKALRLSSLSSPSVFGRYRRRSSGSRRLVPHPASRG